MLGALFAVLSAATFAFNNAAMRRGVITGTPIQGMAITIPIGLLCFFPAALVVAATTGVPHLALAGTAWMAGVGIVHFIIGRYCNYRANQEAGVNLTAPVVQLQVAVAVILAVVVLHEPCTVLQAIGGIVMLAGSLVTQRQPHEPAGAASRDKPAAAPEPTFLPRRAAGYLFASLAALGYGTSPIMARIALEHTSPATGVIGGLIAYAAATAAIATGLVSRTFRKNVGGLQRENLRWFLYSGLFVATAQGFNYAALSIAPIMLVAPILQLSLVFRFVFANALTPDHEVWGRLVIIGSVLSIAGACAISIDTDLIVHALALPQGIADVLRWRIAGG